jgi:16S rRNA (guanine1207-N2)-methyltransferase
MELDAYLASLRKDIVFTAKLGQQSLEFHTTWGLFSPREIDEGTYLLVEYLDVNTTDCCLDLGCGYGPIGISMAKMAPEGRTTLVDKDFVAVEFANKNIAGNRVTNAAAVLSNGFEQLPKDAHFDVIASNIPAKVGKELLTLWLHEARHRINPGGRFYVVTINGLRQFMKRNLTEVFGNYKKLKQGKTYTVAVAVKE